MIVNTAAINVKSTSNWKILNITIITNASCNNASTADNAYVNRNRILTYKMITAEAINTAINAFLAISLPIVGETVLTFGSVPYLSWKNVLFSQFHLLIEHLMYELRILYCRLQSVQYFLLSLQCSIL